MVYMAVLLVGWSVSATGSGLLTRACPGLIAAINAASSEAATFLVASKAVWGALGAPHSLHSSSTFPLGAGDGFDGHGRTTF